MPVPGAAVDFGCGGDALTVGDWLQYIGECENLAKRYSSTGYGRISPRNCHVDGQSTNCKSNSFVLRHAKAGEAVTLWFQATEAMTKVEVELIEESTPPWNGRREPGRAVCASGAERVRVRAGDLHRMTRAYSGGDHRMPVCCAVMRRVMKAGDVQIEAPPRGNGAGLTIEYRLPR